MRRQHFFYLLVGIGVCAIFFSVIQTGDSVIPPTPAFSKIIVVNSNNITALTYKDNFTLTHGKHMSIIGYPVNNTVWLDANVSASGNNLGTHGFGIYSGNADSSTLNFLKLLCGSGMTCFANSTNVFINATVTSSPGGSGVTSLNALTGALTIACVSGNTTCTSGGTTITVNTAYNVIVTNGAKQTFTKDLDHGNSLNDIFGYNNIKVRNPIASFTTTIANSAQYKNNTLNVPAINGTSDKVILENGSAIFTQKNQFANGLIADGLILNKTGAKTNAYTISCKDDFVSGDTSSSNFTFTLPSAVTCGAGKIFMIKDLGFGGNVLTIGTTSSQTIDGFTSTNMTHNNETAVFISDGTNYARVSSDTPALEDMYARTTTHTAKFSNAITGGTTGTLLYVAGKLYAFPLTVPYNMQIDKMWVEVSTASNPTSNLCRAGLYQDSGRMYPTKLVANSDTGTFDGTQAVKTLTPGSAITLQKGHYWIAWACATAGTTQPTVRALGGGQTQLLGVPITMGANAGNTGYNVAFTFGALPSTYPVGGAVISTNPMEMLLEVSKG